MVKKLNILAAICLAAFAAPALAFAPQGPVSSKVLSTNTMSFEKTVLFMSDDGDVSHLFGIELLLLRSSNLNSTDNFFLFYSGTHQNLP